MARDFLAEEKLDRVGPPTKHEVQGCGRGAVQKDDGTHHFNFRNMPRQSDLVAADVTVFFTYVRRMQHANGAGRMSDRRGSDTACAKVRANRDNSKKTEHENEDTRIDPRSARHRSAGP